MDGNLIINPNLCLINILSTLTKNASLMCASTDKIQIAMVDPQDYIKLSNNSKKSEKKNLDDEVIWSNVQTKFHQGLSTYSNDRKWNRVGLHTYCWEWQRSSELFELHRFQMFSITALNYMEQNQQLDSSVSFGWGTNVTVFSPL